ncbi:MAG: phosphoribosylaminoimidazolesuccinocarboxamide synthase [Saprospiraceae bacterium]|nr:phosphoribosylaminoimidazolesuccinocarboxamide synthase [Saprospiraceae bacterium]
MSKQQNAIGTTNFNFPNQEKVYNGKVRDVYFVGDKLVMVATDRISAFDHILPRPIPYKGQVLNQVAHHFLQATRDIVPNWLEATPDPNVAVGKKCEPIMLEMVVRGYMAGHAWREYKAGKRELCGEIMLDGLRQNDRFPRPLITPATKAEEGHDEDISKAEILAQGIVSPAQWEQLEDYTLQLFWRGTEMAAERGLILVDTKYEFGLIDGEIILMDEIHTPDSSRYFYADGYEERQEKGEPQKQLSKEFVREWLMDHGFQGKEGQKMPEMPDDFVDLVSQRYIELYETITGKSFDRAGNENPLERIEKNVTDYLKVH